MQYFTAITTSMLNSTVLLPIKQAVPTLYVKHVLLPIKQAVPTLYVKLLKATTRERKFMSNSLCSNDINYI